MGKVQSNPLKSKLDSLNDNTRALIKFLGITLILILLGLLYHFSTDQNTDATQKFFEERKKVKDFHQYREDEKDAKKRAEKNIFLQ